MSQTRKCTKSKEFLVSSRLSNILEMHHTYHWRYILHTQGLSAKGAKADVKKMQTLDDPPHFKIQLFLFSFLLSLFKSFQIDHGDISPSLMVLLTRAINVIGEHQHENYKQELATNPDNLLLFTSLVVTTVFVAQVKHYLVIIIR